MTVSLTLARRGRDWNWFPSNEWVRLKCGPLLVLKAQSGHKLFHRPADLFCWAPL